MEYIPSTHQFICVVNKKFDPPQLLNAVGHMSAALVGQYEDMSRLRFRNFIDQDKGVHPCSENGFIILRSKNSNQLRTLRDQLIKEGILFSDFTETMVPGNYVTQQEEFDKTPEQDLEYIGVCFFVEKEKSRELTKKFSMYVG